MQKMHLHLPNRMHMTKTDWHTWGVHMRDLIHDPRFWATLALVGLFGLIILTALLSEGTTSSGSYNPYNPYWP